MSTFDISFIDSNGLIVNDDFDLSLIDSSDLIVTDDVESVSAPSKSIDSLAQSSATVDQSSELSSDHTAPQVNPSFKRTRKSRSKKPKTPLIYVGIESNGGACSRVFSTPNGSKLYKPDVDAEFLPPPIGTVYTDWQEIVAMYSRYASKAGFSTKLGTNKDRPENVSFRFIHCHRYGKPRFGNFSMANHHKRRSNRIKLTNCKACIRFKIYPGTSDLILYDWVEHHNHPLIGQEFMDFSKEQRTLTYSEQHMIHSLSLHNIGPNIAHKVQCTLKGGHHYVRGKRIDYKNWRRNIKLFIGHRDAQLTVNCLASRTTNLHNFFFYYKVEQMVVKALFWADDVSRCHFIEFGDVLAFDATYKTNMYKMIFVPFTGVDHHKRCVTFGAGLICDETIESYVWLLETFVKCHPKPPILVLTDQDAAMRSAVLKVFPTSAHRLCMWHIMMKLPAKIKGCNVDNDEVRTAIHNLVWDVLIDKDDFEMRWNTLMSQYNLTGHDWLNDMYGIRERWVPCYFSHLDMCCLMKTTSMCESSNAMFKVNTNRHNSLLQFLMSFDTAIDGQRHNQRELEFNMMNSSPLLHTNLRIEEHASRIYTPALFVEVQKEIERGMLQCTNNTPTVIGDVKLYTVTQYNRHFVPVCQFEVAFDVRDKATSCTCNLFTRIGYLCRHIFCVYRPEQVHAIPDRYISNRWKRDSLPRRVYDITNRYSVDNRVETRLRNEILDTVALCADRLRHNPTELSALCEQMKALKIKIFADVPYDPECNRTNAVISDILRVPETGPSTLILQHSVTKGSGYDKDKENNSGKRFVGPREKAINKIKKGKVARLCGNCKQHGHNARSCEKVQAAKAEAAAKLLASKASAAATMTDPT
ncbi:hypothetical protein SSX86_019711 [Deinandra increscens subsp. villosa]|uniref:SWIM-type domain-containing protein n=1 Tax=Deinandra increscens subsp. villosa TaxID=3103831 RepID=A0AAP0CTB9_9ASTR